MRFIKNNEIFFFFHKFLYQKSKKIKNKILLFKINKNKSFKKYFYFKNLYHYVYNLTEPFLFKLRKWYKNFLYTRRNFLFFFSTIKLQNFYKFMQREKRARVSVNYFNIKLLHKIDILIIYLFFFPSSKIFQHAIFYDFFFKNGIFLHTTKYFIKKHDSFTFSLFFLHFIFSYKILKTTFHMLPLFYKFNKKILGIHLYFKLLKKLFQRYLLWQFLFQNQPSITYNFKNFIKKKLKKKRKIIKKFFKKFIFKPFILLVKSFKLKSKIFIKIRKKYKKLRIFYYKKKKKFIKIYKKLKRKKQVNKRKHIKKKKILQFHF